MNVKKILFMYVVIFLSSTLTVSAAGQKRSSSDSSNVSSDENNSLPYYKKKSSEQEQILTIQLEADIINASLNNPDPATSTAIDNFLTLLNDASNKPSLQNTIQKAIIQLLENDNLADNLTNSQAWELITIIKQQAFKKYKQHHIFIERISDYIYGDKDEKTLGFPAVPNAQLNRPQIDYFPLSVQDLIDYGFLTNIEKQETINLKDNGLTFINPGIFNNLPKLKKLRLDGNNLKYIEPGTFNNLPQLKHLDLNYNYLDQSKEDIRQQNPTLPHDCDIEVYDQYR